MIPHGTKVLALILALRSELFKPILVDITDLLALGVEIKLGVARRLDRRSTTTHCYREEALEGVCGLVRMATAIEEPSSQRGEVI